MVLLILTQSTVATGATRDVAGCISLDLETLSQSAWERWKDNSGKLLGGALVSTMANGDSGGQIRFLELLGNGMVEVNRNSEALMFFERAIKIAEPEKNSGLPFMAYEGKAQALVALGRPDEARNVLQDALSKAQSQQKQGHQAQLLIILGKLALARRASVWVDTMCWSLLNPFRCHFLLPVIRTNPNPTSRTSRFRANVTGECCSKRYAQFS